MGVMAIGTAGVAQAETGACWGYRANPGSTLRCFNVSLEARPILAIENITGTHPSAATLTVTSLNMEITCTTAAFIEGGLLSANGSIFLGWLEFGGCFTRKLPIKGLELLPLCDPHDSVAGLGKIRTEKLSGLIVLHKTSPGGSVFEPVVEISPDSGTTLAVIKLFNECALAEGIVVTGALVLQDRALTIVGGDPENKTAKEEFEKHKVTHLIREFPFLKLMKVGANTVSITGSANVTLGGEHSGLEWAGLPA
jgi:hypothetical protein